ncbi:MULTISPECIES: sensor histidine kinase [Streptomyces]|uniref:histidine kinase n=2 Tax=Streptomyces TaxID=1883 RepID=A0A3R7ELZ7_9ACTN|nr:MULTISPECIES: HAMP domain-containing sensor histidine kinase [Streptomyces]KNE81670.1 histidine kinase [Streptomyces fradiae]OFA49981.1 two-component sensor histidine kinase [Streptomyces fradiae]PQM23581.1 sensor histidine kinase [Streptomyces xinghaiensis]RKM92245.1 sensor histidine kinase [Streptomyces xinghaiensis]RNC70216.1 sensor histidine kinase [Streptomyces xinghaiensis]
MKGPSVRGRSGRLPLRGRGGRLSLRGRLLTISVLLLVAALLASTAVLVTLLRRDLVHQVDDRLRTAATVAARVPVPSGVAGGPVERAPSGDFYLAYLDADGRVLRVVRSAEGSAPGLPALDAAAVGARGGRPFEAPSADGGDAWRVIAEPTVGAAGEAPGEGTAHSVVVAGSLSQVGATIRQLGVRVLVIDSLVLMLLGVVGWFAVRAGLRPLRRIEATAAAIAGGDLTHRVPQPVSTRTELGRLSAALNGMLDRIEAGDAARDATEQRMRRFLADASHELRTPLFGVKGFTELYRMGGMPERTDVDAAMGRIEREAGRLVRLVEDLLLLARLDEGAAGTDLPLRLTPMDLRTLAADALHDLRALDPGRPVTLTGPGGGRPGGAPVLGDEARLRQVTSNLVGNAIAHTAPGTPVRIGVGTEQGRAVLELRDEGPGMSAEQAARAFDRFYRADSARGRAEGGGAGLGLAIVDSLVSAHRGRVEIHTAPGAGATVRVLLPLAP